VDFLNGSCGEGDVDIIGRGPGIRVGAVEEAGLNGPCAASVISPNGLITAGHLSEWTRKGSDNVLLLFDFVDFFSFMGKIAPLICVVVHVHIVTVFLFLFLSGSQIIFHDRVVIFSRLLFRRRIGILIKELSDMFINPIRSFRCSDTNVMLLVIECGGLVTEDWSIRQLESNRTSFGLSSGLWQLGSPES
jgi:hypothetical protein